MEEIDQVQNAHLIERCDIFQIKILSSHYSVFMGKASEFRCVVVYIS